MVKRNIKKGKENQRSSSGNMLFQLVRIAGIFVLFFISYKIFHQNYKQNQINLEITNLQKEIEALSQDNQNLSELISYLQTDEFREKEAKDKLNLIREGEQLVLVKGKEVVTEVVPQKEKKEAQVVIDRPNYYWWWHYFFKI